jgi:hypothetical protein
MATNRQLELRLVALETWKVAIDTWKTGVDSWRATINSWKSTTDSRLAALEALPAGTDYSAQIAALQAKNVEEDNRLTVLENKVCPQQSVLDDILARITALETKAETEAAAQDVLEADHIPTP